MKKNVVLVSAVVMGLSVCVANSSELTSTTFSAVETVAEANVPTGFFKNGNDFIKVNDGWLRIVIGGNAKEYNYTVEMDPWGGYILKFNGESATIASNGQSIYYNGVTYKKY